MPVEILCAAEGIISGQMVEKKINNICVGSDWRKRERGRERGDILSVCPSLCSEYDACYNGSDVGTKLVVAFGAKTVGTDGKGLTTRIGMRW